MTLKELNEARAESDRVRMMAQVLRETYLGMPDGPDKIAVMKQCCEAWDEYNKKTLPAAEKAVTEWISQGCFDPFNQKLKQLGEEITISEEDIENSLGYFDEKTLHIGIQRSSPNAGKHIILLHELIHLVESQLYHLGLIRKMATEEYVEGLAANLIIVLTAAGMWRGVTMEELNDFFKQQELMEAEAEGNA